jgi:hypothetical protein
MIRLLPKSVTRLNIDSLNIQSSNIQKEFLFFELPEVEIPTQLSINEIYLSLGVNLPVKIDKIFITKETQIPVELTPKIFNF